MSGCEFENQLDLVCSTELEKDLDKIDRLMSKIRKRAEHKPDDLSYFDMCDVHSIVVKVLNRSNAGRIWPAGESLIAEAQTALYDAIDMASEETREKEKERALYGRNY